ncbi:MAG: hypothetical protein AB7F75_03385 [Planctomycetota bacterium]
MASWSRMRVLTLLVFLCCGSLLRSDEGGQPDPAKRLETLESSIKDGDINAVIEAANFAKNNGLPDDANRLFNQALGLDAFNAKAHAGLGHKKFMDCWCEVSEIEDFETTLNEEKKDPSLQLVYKSIFDNNKQIGREALKKFDGMCRAWNVDVAYRLMERTEDVFFEDICTDIFQRWAGDRARDLWLKRIRKSRNVGGALKMVGYLQANLTSDLSNPVTKFLIAEVLSERNENISLKCLDLLATVKTDEIIEILRKFMPKCNNQNVKQKLLSIL